MRARRGGSRAVVRLVVLGVVVLLVLPSSAIAASLVVGSDGSRVHASEGSGCVSEEPEPDGSYSTTCADALYPLTVEDFLPVSARDHVVLRFRPLPGYVDEPLRVSVGLVRLGTRTGYDDLSWDRRASPIPGPRELWAVRLPGRLQGADVLDVFARYDGIGGENYWAGLDVR